MRQTQQTQGTNGTIIAARRAASFGAESINNARQCTGANRGLGRKEGPAREGERGETGRALPPRFGGESGLRKKALLPEP